MDTYNNHWKVESTPAGLRFQHECVWSDAECPEWEFAHVKGFIIEGVVYDKSENAMIFLIAGKYNGDPCQRLLKVAADPEGRIQYHSLDSPMEDYKQIMQEFHAGDTDPRCPPRGYSVIHYQD